MKVNPVTLSLASRVSLCQAWRRAAAAVLASLFFPAAASAHGAPLDRAVGWQDWNWDPVILLSLVVILWLYCRGWLALQGRKAKSGQLAYTRLPNQSLPSRGHGVPGAGRITVPWRVAAFALGMFILWLALISPLDPLSEQLGSAHMVQHMILMTVVAPLLVAGGAALVCLCGLSPASRRVVGRLRRGLGNRGRRWFWNPLVVWALYAAVMWVWHVPALYEAALRNAFFHDLQHLTFFIAACLFWRVLLDPVSRLTLKGGLAVLYLFTTTLHATVLGVFMTIAPTVWYSEYEARTQWWGLTPLEDQQLAGLIMWMPACAAYALVAIALFAKALEDRADESSGTLLKGMVAR